MATTPAGYQSTTDPRQLAANQRQLLYGQGQQLQNQFQQYGTAAQGGANPNTVSGTADYLNQIEDPLAQGQGGYNASETSQIELSPQDKQNIVTGAGISAGENTAASVGAADRAANAAGGNPMALAAYRARAAQQQGAQAGQAMTQARIGAQQAGAAGAENVGQTRIAQQNQGLNYYQGQNQQQNQNVQQANQLQASNYGTTGNVTNQAAGQGLQASQTPSTFDKVLGGVSGALSFLDEGDVMPGKTPAVVGENGPEKIVDLDYRKNAHAVAGLHKVKNTVHEKLGATHDLYMDDGGVSEGDTDSEGLPLPGTPAYPAPAASASVPFWKKLSNAARKSMHSQVGSQNPQQAWTPVTPYQQIGQAVGNVVSHLPLADGGISGQGKGGIFTKPTKVLLDKHEAVVPLGYRPGAKVRPSMAALPAARQRVPYGAHA